MNKNKPQVHATKWINLPDMMVNESSQAQKSTRYDSIFIKIRKNCSMGQLSGKGMRGALLFIYHISIKKQRGHTFKDLEMCKGGKIS